MATVTLAQHIEGFPAAGQKRSYAALLPSGGGGDGIFKGERAAEAAGVAGARRARVPASSARPARGTNETAVVARACAPGVQRGQIVFVWKNQGRLHENASQERVITLEALNALLEDPKYYVTGGFANKPETKYVKALDGTPTSIDLTHKDVEADDTHPINRWNLDGIVQVEADVDETETVGYTPVSARNSGAICNVAVCGPCELTVCHLPSLHDTLQQVPSSEPAAVRAAPHVHVKPRRVLDRIYVILAATRVKEGEFKLSYNVVSLSNIETQLLPKVDKFDQEAIIFRVWKLGVVLDTAFGNPRAPQLMVAVCPRPLLPLLEKMEGNVPIFANDPPVFFDTAMGTEAKLKRRLSLSSATKANTSQSQYADVMLQLRVLQTQVEDQAAEIEELRERLDNLPNLNEQLEKINSEELNSLKALVQQQAEKNALQDNALKEQGEKNALQDNALKEQGEKNNRQDKTDKQIVKALDKLTRTLDGRLDKLEADDKLGELRNALAVRSKNNTNPADAEDEADKLAKELIDARDRLRDLYPKS